MGLDEKVYILIGVGPLRSEKAAEYLRNHVPGVVIPDEIVDRLRKTPKGKKREEGKRICVEIIQEVQDIKCVSGVHVMAYRQEELVAEIIEDAGLLPRPMQPTARDSDRRARPGKRRRAGRRTTIDKKDDDERG
jgi:methylenetetrahydrofolate reductase (NADPH)